MPQPPVVQSHAHTVQHGMTTHETHAVNHAPPQPGMGTQPFYQNGVGTQPHQNGMQLPPVQSGFQPPVQHGMGMPMQHGTTPVQQPGIGSQPTLSHGMGVPQTGMAIPPQNGVGTQPLYSVYSTSPGRYVPNEVSCFLFQHTCTWTLSHTCTISTLCIHVHVHIVYIHVYIHVHVCTCTCGIPVLPYSGTCLSDSTGLISPYHKC